MDFYYFLLYFFLVLCFPLLGLYLNSYIKKKAENLATSEDINILTSKVEQIKFEYQKLIEKEKTQNQLLSVRIKSYNDRIDNLLFEFIDAANTIHFAYFSLDLDLTDIAISNNSKFNIVSYLSEINKLQNSIIILDVKIHAYFSNEKNIIDSLTSILKILSDIAQKLNTISFFIINNNSTFHQLIEFRSNTSYVPENKESFEQFINQYYDNIHEYLTCLHDTYPDFISYMGTFISNTKVYFEKYNDYLD